MRLPLHLAGLIAMAVLMTGAAAPSHAAGAGALVAPHNAVVPSDPAVMALARAAVGTACRYTKTGTGPQVDGFTELKGVGQFISDKGTVVIRQRGASRVAFLALVGAKDCRFAAAEPLPPHAKGEEFLQCRVDDPDPDKIPPLSEGLGLRQPGTTGLAAYLEVDFKRKALVPRDGSDKRIACSGFESGD